MVDNMHLINDIAESKGILRLTLQDGSTTLVEVEKFKTKFERVGDANKPLSHIEISTSKLNSKVMEGLTGMSEFTLYEKHKLVGVREVSLFIPDTQPDNTTTPLRGLRVIQVASSSSNLDEAYGFFSVQEGSALLQWNLNVRVFGSFDSFEKKESSAGFSQLLQALKKFKKENNLLINFDLAKIWVTLEKGDEEKIFSLPDEKSGCTVTKSGTEINMQWHVSNIPNHFLEILTAEGNTIPVGYPNTIDFEAVDIQLKSLDEIKYIFNARLEERYRMGKPKLSLALNSNKNEEQLGLTLNISFDRKNPFVVIPTTKTKK